MSVGHPSQQIKSHYAPMEHCQNYSAQYSHSRVWLAHAV